MSIEAVELWKINFCELENSVAAAVSSEKVGTFVGNGELTAHGVCCEFIRKMEPVKLHLAWDNGIYPVFKVKKIEVLNG